MHNILISIFLVLLLYAVGIMVYYHLEGWGFVDSIYFQTMTFTTIGYGDIVPETEAGKLFTVAISWIGISIAFYVLYALSTYRERVLDKKIESTLFRLPNIIRPRRPKKKSKKIRK